MLLLRGRGVTIAAAFAALLIVLSAGYAGAFLLTQEAHARRAQTATNGAPDIQGNVYHLVLNSMRTDVFLKALERTGLAPQFAGFELFRNNVSNYVTTVPSSASYFTGTFYRGGRWKTWIEQWYRKGILATLSKRGYKVWMYAPFPYWNTRHVDRFWYNFDILEQEEGIVANVGFHGLIQVWLASLAPNPLTNEALPLAATLAGPDLPSAHRPGRAGLGAGAASAGRGDHAAPTGARGGAAGGERAVCLRPRGAAPHAVRVRPRLPARRSAQDAAPALARGPLSPAGAVHDPAGGGVPAASAGARPLRCRRR